VRLLCALRSAERCQGIYATAEWFATNGNLQKILRHALLEHSSYREYNFGGTMHCVVTHCGLCAGVMSGFVIVGHSLGAGISSTLALLWYRRHTFVDTVSAWALRCLLLRLPHVHITVHRAVSRTRLLSRRRLHWIWTRTTMRWRSAWSRRSC